MYPALGFLDWCACARPPFSACDIMYAPGLLQEANPVLSEHRTTLPPNNDKDAKSDTLCLELDSTGQVRDRACACGDRERPIEDIVRVISVRASRVRACVRACVIINPPIDDERTVPAR
jgi:hypothetical protein